MKVFSNRIIRILLLLAATWALFNCIFFLGTNPSHWIDFFFQWLMRIAWFHVNNTTLRDFLVYGFLTGVGGFFVYVPNIVLLFLFSHLLRNTGLAQRAAAIVNPVFRFVGLDGSSFQPLLFGFGCSVTAIHGAHFIPHPKKRLVTMLIAPFMSCGSKFGVYVLLISVVFAPRQAGTVLFGLYVLGITFAFLSAMIFRRIFRIGKEVADTYEIAVPPLAKPDVVKVLRDTLLDGWVFCLKAGSVIVVTAMVIWALSYWPGVSEAQYNELAVRAKQAGQLIPSRQALSYHNSYAATIGRFIEPAFRPLGQNWKNSIALVTSIAGRTTIISTLVTLYGIDYSPHSREILTRALSADPDFSRLSGLAMMLFVLLCGSCLASITMFYNETRSLPKTALFVAYPLAVAWIVSAVFYTVGKSFAG